MRKNDSALFLALFVFLEFHHGRLATKFYSSDNLGDFSLSPFVNPIDMMSVNGAGIGVGDVRGSAPISSRVNYVDSSLAYTAENRNVKPGAAGLDFIKVQATTSMTTRISDVPYDVQANQLLEYLNSAGLISSPLTNNNQNNYLNRPAAVLMEDRANSNKILTTSSNPNTNNLTSDSMMKQQRLKTILGQLNVTNRVYFDKEKKMFRLGEESSDSGGRGQAECFNCSEIRDSSECRDIQEIEYFELINLFCCECNANM